MWIHIGLEFVYEYICRLVTSWVRSLEGWGKGLWLTLGCAGVWFRDTCWRWREPWAGKCTLVTELYTVLISLFKQYARATYRTVCTRCTRRISLLLSAPLSRMGAIKGQSVQNLVQIINDCDYDIYFGTHLPGYRPIAKSALTDYKIHRSKSHARTI